MQHFVNEKMLFAQFFRHLALVFLLCSLPGKKWEKFPNELRTKSVCEMMHKPNHSHDTYGPNKKLTQLQFSLWT